MALEQLIEQLREIQKELNKTGDVADETRTKLQALLETSIKALEANPGLVDQETEGQVKSVLSTQGSAVIKEQNPESLKKLEEVLNKLLTVLQVKTGDAKSTSPDQAIPVKIVETAGKAENQATISTTRAEQNIKSIVSSTPNDLEAYLSRFSAGEERKTKLSSMVAALNTKAGAVSPRTNEISVVGEEKFKAYQALAKQTGFDIVDTKVEGEKYSGKVIKAAQVIEQGTIVQEKLNQVIESRTAAEKEATVVSKKAKTVRTEATESDTSKLNKYLREQAGSSRGIPYLKEGMSEEVLAAVHSPKKEFTLETFGKSEVGPQEIKDWEGYQLLAKEMGYVIEDYKYNKEENLLKGKITPISETIQPVVTKVEPTQTVQTQTVSKQVVQPEVTPTPIIKTEQSTIPTTNISTVAPIEQGIPEQAQKVEIQTPKVEIQSPTPVESIQPTEVKPTIEPPVVTTHPVTAPPVSTTINPPINPQIPPPVPVTQPPPTVPVTPSITSQTTQVQTQSAQVQTQTANVQTQTVNIQTPNLQTQPNAPAQPTTPLPVTTGGGQQPPAGGIPPGGQPPIIPPVPPEQPIPPTGPQPAGRQLFGGNTPIDQFSYTELLGVDVTLIEGNKKTLEKMRENLSLKLGSVKKADMVLNSILEEIQNIVAREGFAMQGGAGISIDKIGISGLKQTKKGVEFTPTYTTQGFLLDEKQGVLTPRKRYVTEQGTNFDIPPEYSLREKVGMELGKTRGFTRATNTIERDIVNQEKFYQKLGVNIDSVTYSTRALKDGTISVSAAFSDGFQILGTTTEYLQKAERGYKVLTQAEYEAAKAAQFTQKQLSELQKVSPAVFKKAEGYGFKPEDLKKKDTEASTGYSRYQFSQTDPSSGVVRNLTMTTDRFGGIMTDTSRKFRGFIDTIRRDMVSFAQWGISAAVVYGSMQKLNQIVEIAINNESKLADITIALGDAQKSTNAIFEEAATVAQATGEHLDGVLEGYVLAYRATGTITDQEERFIATNKVLTDSLVLSKLSGMEQAAAMDVLSGAIRQTQKDNESASQSFSRGRELIDQWVTVTRNANVDLETLAMSFSITAESALGAGMSIEELNAVVAVLAEKTGGLGAKETGNAVRALVGGLYQGGAEAALSKYGISIKNAEGQTRSFLEVMTQISSYNQQGLITDAEMNKIAYTLGGGVRRGQQYLAFLKDLSRVYQLVGVQTDSAGASEKALGTKLETTQTAVTRLANAFQMLAQSLGGEGGVLLLMKNLLNLSSSVVEIFSKLSSLIGTSGLGVLGVTAGSLAFGGVSGAGRQKAVREGLWSAGSSVFEGVGAMFGARSPNARTANGIRGMGAGETAFRYGGAALATVIPAVLNLQQGETARAGANIGGGILGALITGGNPVGAIIGSAVAEAFTKKVEENSKYIASSVAILGETPEEKAARLKREEAEKKAKEEKGLTEPQRIRQQITERAAELYTPLPAEVNKNLAAMANYLNNLSFKQTNEPYQQMLMEKPQIAEDPLIKQLMDKLTGYDKYTGKSLTPPPSEVEMTRLTTTYAKELSSYTDEMFQKLQQDLISGKIGAKEYLTGKEQIEGIPTVAAGIVTAGTEELGTALGGITSQEAQLKAIMDILINSPGEATQTLKDLTTTINDLNNKIAESTNGFIDWIGVTGQLEPTPIEKTAGYATSALEIREKAKKDRDDLVNALDLSRKRTTMELPTIVEMPTVTKKEFETIVAPEADRILRQRVKTTKPEIDTEEEYQEWKRVMFPEGFWMELKDGMEEVGAGMFSPEILQKGLDLAEKVGKKLSDNIGLSFYNKEESSKFEAVMRAYPEFKTKLEGIGYPVNEEPQLVILDDGSIRKETIDTKVTNILMQQLVDLNQKQLDGIYNLPSGGTFYVPSQAAGMYPQGGGAGDYDALLRAFLDKWNPEGEFGIGTETEVTKTEPPKVTAFIEKVASGTSGVPSFTGKPPSFVGSFSGVDPSKFGLPFGSVPPFTGSVSGVDPDKFSADVRTIEEIMRTTHYYPYTQPGSTPQGKPQAMSPTSAATLSVLGGPDINVLKSVFQTAFSNIKQKVDFKLNLSSSTILVVDGRQMANVVKKYLYSDLVSSDTGSVSKTV